MTIKRNIILVVLVIGINFGFIKENFVTQQTIIIINMNFSRQELINMVYCIGEADQNILLASRIYHQKFPEAVVPQSAAFQKLNDRFEATGSVAYPKKH